MRRWLLFTALFFFGFWAEGQDPGRPSNAGTWNQQNPYSLDELQRRNFLFFWELADTVNYQVPDRWPTQTFSSIAATGFGLTAYLIGAERGWITREQAAARVLKTLTVLKNLPQGPEATGMSGYKGFFYHFLDLKTAKRFKQVELSTIDTGLLMAGILSCMSYFDGDDQLEKNIRDIADILYRRVEWDWPLNEKNRLSMGWHPEKGFIANDWRGYYEAMFLNLMALGSPTHPAPKALWENWCEPYYWAEYKGQEMVNFGPLFGHQYSACWIDFRGIQDAFMREKGIDYFENSRRATLANRQYCIDNPLGWKGYGPNLWGLTACDGPQDFNRGGARHDWYNGRDVFFNGYSARGAAVDYEEDDGTIAPTAAGGSLPFAPEYCLPALENMWNAYGEQLLGRYGFKDAFNPSFTFAEGLEKGWFDVDYLGIDQGPIVIMIENYRSGFIWNLMKKNPYIVAGLKKAGFKGGWIDQQKTPEWVSNIKTEAGPNPEVPIDPAALFQRKQYRDKTGNTLPYQLMVPASTLHPPPSTLHRLPLVIFLHGSGESGTDNSAQMKNGVFGFCEKEVRGKHPCYLLVPQCPPGQRWGGSSRDWEALYAAEPTMPMRLLLELIEKLLKDHPDIDPKRVYITGLSMGGFGTFDALMRRPDLFAAGLPLCGGGDPAHAEQLKGIPLWVWHGTLDDAVPVKFSHRIVEVLRGKNIPVRFNELSTFGHNIWEVVYYRPEVIEWLFSQIKQ